MGSFMSRMSVWEQFHETPIYFYPIHRRMAGRATTAIVLAFLFRQFCYHKRDTIFYTDLEVMGATGVSRHELNTAKDDIRELGFIDIKRAGAKGRLHYIQDCEALNKALIQLSGKRITGGTSVIRKADNRIGSVIRKADNTLREHTQDENTHTLSAGRVRPGTAIPKRWHAMAAQLAAAIAKAKKINRTSKVGAWAQSLQQLHKTDGIPSRRIRRALDWYCANYPERHREQYFLAIESGDAFRRKFIKLEDAMARDAAAEGAEDGEQSEGNPVVTSRQIPNKPGATLEDILGESF